MFSVMVGDMHKNVTTDIYRSGSRRKVDEERSGSVAENVDEIVALFAGKARQ